MSWRSVVRAAVRLGVVVSVALAGLTFATDDAEARGGKVRSAPHQSHQGDAPSRKSDSAEQGHNSGATYVPVPRVRSRDASRGEGNPTTDAGAAMARRPMFAGPIAPISDKDLDVDGCADGMICTVCVAGCYGDAGEIVDAQTKPPVLKPREE